MFGNGMQKNKLPLIIVCDDKDMVYAKKLSGGFVDKIMPVVVGAPKMLIDRSKTVNAVKAQQYKTLIKVFYEDGLKSFVEG